MTVFLGSRLVTTTGTGAPPSVVVVAVEMCVTVYEDVIEADDKEEVIVEPPVPVVDPVDTGTAVGLTVSWAVLPLPLSVLVEDDADDCWVETGVVAVKDSDPVEDDRDDARELVPLPVLAGMSVVKDEDATGMVVAGPVEPLLVAPRVGEVDNPVCDWNVLLPETGVVAVPEPVLGPESVLTET